tara:strand:+ start:301 stop:1809 length:1509 start_codon:yes stop_codon:yes gene_type:complete
MALTPGASLNSVPSARQLTLSSNYVDFTVAAGSWTQQYLPEVMEEEAKVFGNRTISGFLSQVGAEEAMASDQVVWSEMGRLHLAYICNITSLTAGTPGGGRITITDHIDGATTYTANSHGIRPGDTVLLTTTAGTLKCHVHTAAVGANVIDLVPYGQANLGSPGVTMVTGVNNGRVLVYGSEFGKGSGARTRGNEPDHTTFTNKPIILRDYYEVSGSDASQIGWIEVAGEEGQSGYLWYVKASGDTRARFSDYIEMSMLEGELGGAATDQTDSSVTLVTTGAAATGSNTGTEGMFAAIRTRGNQASLIDTASGAAANLAEFDRILNEFDKQGSIEENMMFLGRDSSIAVDDMLATMTGGGANVETSYGVFNNSEDMALNLGFSGFRRGSYDFYKSDFKYLNSMDGRAGVSTIGATLVPDAIRGVFVPAGVSSVYDRNAGMNMKRPFLHVRYRAAANGDDRKYKSWVTGSVMAATDGDDAMKVHYLSERCLITQGANNFMLLT